jgi:predicted MPP superfamily phosphohydrolase
MSLKSTIGWTIAAGAGLLVYGALVEAQNLHVHRKTLRLRDWPKSLSGIRIGLVADLHVHVGSRNIDLAQRSIQLLRDENPDYVVVAGDFIECWQPDTLEVFWEALGGLDFFRGRLLGCLGNHDYFGGLDRWMSFLYRDRNYEGDPRWLGELFDILGGRMLINEAVTLGGISWVGVDSGNNGDPMPYAALAQADWRNPVVVLWHEPDFVDTLPAGPDLMLSGHSHGGQFVTPWGWAPMTSRNGEKYLRGFFEETPVPLYVTTGVATTGPPSRLFCPPEVVILTIESD